jgi:chemotaxis protein MotA
VNIATFLGIIFGVAILSLATYSTTANISVFINPPGIAIVLGGVIAATFISYPLKEVLRILGVFFTALKSEELPIGNYIHVCVNLSENVSVKGEAHLEKVVASIDNDFMKSGLQMVLDGYSREEIKEILDNRILQYYDQEMAKAGIFRTMSRLSPAFGIIGTLIGLIAMMQAMHANLEALGPALATALTTTLYGALFANLVFLPVAIKIESRIEEITILMNVIRDGILFIKEKAPSPIVLDKLKGYLPPRRWASIKQSRTRKAVPDKGGS